MRNKKLLNHCHDKMHDNSSIRSDQCSRIAGRICPGIRIAWGANTKRFQISRLRFCLNMEKYEILSINSKLTMPSILTNTPRPQMSEGNAKGLLSQVVNCTSTLLQAGPTSPAEWRLRFQGGRSRLACPKPLQFLGMALPGLLPQRIKNLHSAVTKQVCYI